MSKAQSALKHVCNLAPELTLPTLQMRIGDGLQAVTATHQTPMALQVRLRLWGGVGWGWGGGGW